MYTRCRSYQPGRNYRASRRYGHRSPRSIVWFFFIIPFFFIFVFGYHSFSMIWIILLAILINIIVRESRVNRYSHSTQNRTPQNSYYQSHQEQYRMRKSQPVSAPQKQVKPVPTTSSLVSSKSPSFCPGCGVKLDAQMKSMIKENKQIYCPYCGSKISR